jgi:alpha-L-rhamnosidase
VRIEPVPGPGIEWAKTSYDSPAGTIATSWRVDEDGFALEVTLPDGLAADIVLPDGGVQQVTGGSHAFRAVVAPGVRSLVP